MNMNIKIKLSFFYHNKLKFQPGTKNVYVLIITILFTSSVITSY